MVSPYFNGWVIRVSPYDVVSRLLVSEVRNRSAGAKVKLIYFDNDRCLLGKRFAPAFKPEWSPDFLMSTNFIGESYAVCAGIAREIGGWKEAARAGDWDFLLSTARKIDRNEVMHMPLVMTSRILSWGNVVQNFARCDELQCILETVTNEGLSEGVSYIGKDKGRSLFKLSGPVSEGVKVSIIIPTRNNFALLRRCVDSILHLTQYKNYEIIIVDNGSDDVATLAYMKNVQAHKNIRVEIYDHPFNFSELCNFGAEFATGGYLCFLNDDIEINSPEWLCELVRYVRMEHVGVVGAKLLYPTGSVQHCGVVAGLGQVAGHVHKHFSPREKGYLSRLQVASDFSAVTGACMVVRRNVFESVSGFDVKFAVAYNDVDFCLRVCSLGLYNVVNPHSVLLHHESASRGVDDTLAKIRRAKAEMGRMQMLWHTDKVYDPFYSAHLTYHHEDGSIRNHALLNASPCGWMGQGWAETPVGRGDPS